MKKRFQATHIINMMQQYNDVLNRMYDSQDDHTSLSDEDNFVLSHTPLLLAQAIVQDFHESEYKVLGELLTVDKI